MAAAPLTEQVAAVLTRHDVWGLPLTLALSGGMDSVVLLDILCQLRAEATRPQRLDLRTVHIHHGLSANADAWAKFCLDTCVRREVPAQVQRVCVPSGGGIGLEAAAREVRYQALREHGTAVVLTAQHQDDQAETVLHQMLRGTGLNGLAAMGEVRLLQSGQRLLRPLLQAARTQLAQYALDRGLQWVEDESNLDTTLTRNWLRRELMPTIQDRFPKAAVALAQTARHAAEAAVMNEALAVLDLAWDGRQASAAALDHLGATRQANALYHWLRWQGVVPPSRRQLDDWAVALFRPAQPGRLRQAGGHSFRIERRRAHLKLVLFR